MLKTIKTTKQLRLDELIKYVWENSVNEKRVFLGNHEQRVVFDNVGGFYPSGYAYSPDTTFKVEVEEEITKDTKFDTLVSTYPPLGYSCDSFVDVYTNQTINGVISDDKTVGVETERIYTIINGKLELIWERDNQ